MVKYLSFHNSSFALKIHIFSCKWQGHSGQHTHCFTHDEVVLGYKRKSVAKMARKKKEGGGA
jgi:hypothetical protein